MKDVRKSLKNVNVVIHLAYINGTKYFYTKPTEILDVAIKGILNIIDGCKEKELKNFILLQVLRCVRHLAKFPQMKMKA